MIKTVGPVVLINTKPPYRAWDGNQATYLFFPIFWSFLLILFATLSTPLIGGISVVNVDTNGNGTVQLGAWSWCTHGVPNMTDDCSPHRLFSDSMTSDFNQLPIAVSSLAKLDHTIDGSYLIANGVMHVLAALVCWMTTVWTLAACGKWNNKERQAWTWTKQAFAGTAWSAMFILIPWALDLAEVARVKSKLNGAATVTPGAAIWMELSALMLCIVTFGLRVTWLKFKPRPEWTMKNHGDFHDQHQPPISAALPPPDEMPPTWESLAIDAPTIIDEKIAVEVPPRGHIL